MSKTENLKRTDADGYLRVYYLAEAFRFYSSLARTSHLLILLKGSVGTRTCSPRFTRWVSYVASRCLVWRMRGSE